MDKYINVEGKAGLVRSKASGAIINVNSNEMSQARHRQKIWKDQQEELQTLKDDVAVMKDLLLQLVEEKNGRNNN